MRSTVFTFTLVLAALFGCHSRSESAEDANQRSIVVTAAPVSSSAAAAVASAVKTIQQPKPVRLANRAAYVPPQCFTKTREPGDTSAAANPCYVCHTRSEAPNYVNDEDLQKQLLLPTAARDNPWTNLFDPPVTHAAHVSDDDVLSYVRKSNYVDDAGNLVLAAALHALPPAWDGNGNGKWDGFEPDARFAFDDHGFDVRPDGTMTGWRAFAYYPFPGTFFPTNGSFDDVLIRLDPRLRQNARGELDRAVYEINFAIVESLVRRADVAIDPVDEVALGVDLDLDGHLGRASRIAFDATPGSTGKTRMHYVGRAHDDETKGTFPIAPGLFPVGTELLHSVRYLDVGPDGQVHMAARMKELRYGKKTHWASYEVSRSIALRDARETEESPDGTHDVKWQKEVGVYGPRGWLFQGFVEADDGALRPQTYDEAAYCEGCHGGLGATTDSIFSFARKIGGSAPARGWFHWSQHDLRGIAEPKRIDGAYEYALYLKQAKGGDELRGNQEVIRRFFDEHHELRAGEVALLHADIGRLLIPTKSRALDLDRAYLAIVKAQSFDHGRDAALEPSRNVYERAPLGQATGVTEGVVQARLAAE